MCPARGAVRVSLNSKARAVITDSVHGPAAADPISFSGTTPSYAIVGAGELQSIMLSMNWLMALAFRLTQRPTRVVATRCGRCCSAAAYSSRNLSSSRSRMSIAVVSSTSCRDGPGFADSGASARQIGQRSERRRHASEQLLQNECLQLAGHGFGSVRSSMQTGQESSRIPRAGSRAPFSLSLLSCAVFAMAGLSTWLSLLLLLLVASVGAGAGAAGSSLAVGDMSR